MVIKLSKAAMKFERLDTLMYLACGTESKAVDMWISHFADELISLVRIVDLEDCDSLGRLVSLHQKFTDLMASKADQYHKIRASFDQSGGTVFGMGDKSLSLGEASREKFEKARQFLAGFLALVEDVLKRQKRLGFDTRIKSKGFRPC